MPQPGFSSLLYIRNLQVMKGLNLKSPNLFFQFKSSLAVRAVSKSRVLNREYNTCSAWRNGETCTWGKLEESAAHKSAAFQTRCGLKRRWRQCFRSGASKEGHLTGIFTGSCRVNLDFYYYIRWCIWQLKNLTIRRRRLAISAQTSRVEKIEAVRVIYSRCLSTVNQSRDNY